jgi:hypothetical protein
MAYSSVEQTPAGSWYWAAVPKSGGNAQAVAIDIDGAPLSEDNPMACRIVEAP